MINNIFSRETRIHILVWILYTLYFSILVQLFFKIPITLFFVLQAVIHRSGNVLLFYGFVLWILPKYFYYRKWFYFIFFSIISVSIHVLYTYLLEFYIFPFLSITIDGDVPQANKIIPYSLIQASNFIFFALGYYFSQRVLQQQKEIAQRDLAIAQKDIEIANEKAIVAEQKLVLIKKEKELAEEREKNAILAKEKAQAEMAFLRAQINPHFLFNSLNLIYSKVITSTKEVASELILDFSKMMQYATSTKMQEDTVDVNGELDFVKSYIKLFKARNRQGAYIDYEEEGYFGSHRVVPMVLITMVENALKHGLIDDPSNPIIIRASLIDDFFVFMVRNPKNPYPNDIAGKGNTGVGVPNIIKRLDAVYKNGGFTLESENLEDDYIVTFTVNYKLI